MDHLKLVKDSAMVSAVKQLTAYSSNSLNVLYEFLRDIQKISQKAEQEEAKAKNDIMKNSSLVGTETLSETALVSMKALYAQIEKMEVYENVVD